jgi:hypothetical protein
MNNLDNEYETSLKFITLNYKGKNPNQRKEKMSFARLASFKEKIESIKSDSLSNRKKTSKIS